MERLNRRGFVQLASAALAGSGLPGVAEPSTRSGPEVPKLGLVVSVRKGGSAEATIQHVHDLGIPTCQIFFEELTLAQVEPLVAATKKYGVAVSAVSEHNPGPRVFNFDQGPPTIGIVPVKYRRARIDALKLAAEFARACQVGAIHSHMGFIPEDPNDPIYPDAIVAIKEVAQHAKEQGVMVLCETGEETPITMLRMIQDVGTGNLFVNLDVANLILYGKGNPVDAMDVFGSLVRGTHMKDGLFPTNPHALGDEVAIGTGKVDFPKVFQQLKEVKYTRTLTIEREIAGPQQVADILQSKIYLQRLIDQIFLGSGGPDVTPGSRRTRPRQSVPPPDR